MTWKWLDVDLECFDYFIRQNVIFYGNEVVCYAERNECPMQSL